MKYSDTLGSGRNKQYRIIAETLRVNEPIDPSLFTLDPGLAVEIFDADAHEVHYTDTGRVERVAADGSILSESESPLQSRPDEIPGNEQHRWRKLLIGVNVLVLLFIGVASLLYKLRT